MDALVSSLHHRTGSMKTFNPLRDPLLTQDLDRRSSATKSNSFTRNATRVLKFYGTII